MYEVKKYPEKSWSISKMKTMDSCFREYYYTYYGSHNGWIYDSSEESKIAWRLKKLTNIWIMFGEKLHRVIKEVLSSNINKEGITEEFLLNLTRRRLNEAVSDSSIKARTGAWDDYPKGEMLQEYYYNNKLEERDIIEIKDRLKKCIEGFLNSKSFLELKKINRERILELDEEKFEYIMVHDVKVFALIDALYVDNNGNYVIVDWKTGSEGEKDKEQLLIYALYVMQKYDITIDKIKGRVEYLLIGENKEYTFTYEDLNGILHRIDLDLKVIDAFLLNSKENIPKDKEYFSKCDNLKKCNRCKFRKLCNND